MLLLFARTGYTLTADVGAFALTGIAADLRRTAILSADVGTFVLTGQDATLMYAGRVFTLTADAASFVLTGQDAEFAKSSIHVAPVIMMSFSDDGGITWSTEMTAPLGRQGDYMRRIVFRRLGTTRQHGRVFRFRASAAVMRGFMGCAIDVEKLSA